MSDPFVAQIMIVGFNYAPRGWATCDGQLLPIQQNTALFSLLGTTYGGNGQTTFGLPNLSGRAPMHPGQGPGLTPRTLGETDGSSAVTLLTSEMPAHWHPQGAHLSTANTGTPSAAVSPAQTTSNAYGPATSLVAMNDTVGGNQPHNNMQPYLGMNFVIALQGIFPQRP